MLFATASHAALERPSTGRTRTWFRTPPRPLSRLYPRNVALLRSMLCDLNGTLEWLSPALGLDIVHVSVLAHLDRHNGATDVHAVFDHRVATLEFADRELMAYGTSLCARTLISLSWSMIQPVSSWPAFNPSTTTTPTESFSSCTTK